MTRQKDDKMTTTIMSLQAQPKNDEIKEKKYCENVYYTYSILRREIIVHNYFYTCDRQG